MALVLNPDTVSLPGGVDRLVTYLDAHPEAGMVGPKLLKADGVSIDYWGGRAFPQPSSVFYEQSLLVRAVLPRAEPESRPGPRTWRRARGRASPRSGC